MLKFIDLVVASLPLAFPSKSFHPFNQNSSIPRAVENEYLLMRRTEDAKQKTTTSAAAG